MKRVGNLYQKFASKETALRAIDLGTENKRGNYEVRRRFGYSDPLYAGQLDPAKCAEEAERLLRIIENGWQPSPLRHKHIEPPGLKPRDLAIPTLTDHIIGWMLIETIRPVLMRGMYEHSYGSIPGRGIDGARKTIERWTRHDKRCTYFVKLDIRRFYENIDHDLLKALFRTIIKDERLLEIIDKVIDMIPEGVPIGAYPSQWLGNFFLTCLDHFITQELYKLRRGKRTNFVRHYLRYMDDMLLFGSSRSDLEKAVRRIIRFCKERLHLEIKPCWEIKAVEDYAIDMVGYCFRPDRTTLRAGIFLHTARLARKIGRELEQGRVLVTHARAITSLCGWADKANSKLFVREYIEPYLNIKFMQEVVSYADRNQLIGKASVVYCCAGGRCGDYHILYGRAGGAVKWRRPELQCDRLDDYTQLDLWTLCTD